MKQITFYVEPHSTQEITTTISDEEWETYEKLIEEGIGVNYIFQDIEDKYDFVYGKTTIIPAYTAFDMVITDCDCEESKKRPLTPKE